MRLVVARVGRPHGIRGEVTVELRTDVPEQRFVPGAVLYVAAPGRSAARGGSGPGQAQPRGTRPPGRTPQARPPAETPQARPPARLTVSAVRDHNGTLLLGFDEIVGRTAAEALRGALLEAEIAETVEEPDAWYDHQLVGLRVEAPDGTELGRVAAVEHPGAQDLLVVRRPDGAERLVPFVAALVPIVDVDAGRLVVVDPGGLISDVDEA